MSRPASASGGYGFNPATGWVSEPWKNSGTISTSPPTLTTSNTRMMSHGTCVSICSWLSFIVIVLRVYRHAGRNGRFERLGPGDRAHGVVRHDQHAGEEQEAAQQPDRVERVCRLDAFDECVRQRAVRVGGAPHEALH